MRPHMSVAGRSSAIPPAQLGCKLQAGPGCDRIAKKWSVAHWLDVDCLSHFSSGAKSALWQRRAGGRELRVTLISLRRRFTQRREGVRITSPSPEEEKVTPARIAINFGIAINLGEPSKRNAVCGTGLQRHRPACLKVGLCNEEIA